MNQGKSESATGVAHSKTLRFLETHEAQPGNSLYRWNRPIKPDPSLRQMLQVRVSFHHKSLAANILLIGLNLPSRLIYFSHHRCVMMKSSCGAKLHIPELHNIARPDVLKPSSFLGTVVRGLD